MDRSEPMRRDRWRAARRAWGIVSVVLLETILLALSALPAIALVAWWRGSPLASAAGGWIVLALAVAPAVLLFAVVLMAASALATRLLGWRTPADAEMRLADLSWPLLDWLRYVAVSHVVRVVAGTFLRATPLWTWYLRLNGARIGRGVYVNSLALTDHNLLVLGDGVVVGSDVHLSGHTVERGIVRTGRVRVGRGVTIGVGSVVGIDVVIPAGAQVGALSLVPKHSRLVAGVTYVGVPVRPIACSPAAAMAATAANMTQP